MLDYNVIGWLDGSAEKNDFQIWIEIVDDSGQIGVYIEEGAISANNNKGYAA